MPIMIDTHAHIYLPEFEADLEAIMHRALQEGVQKIYLPNIDAASIPSMLALTQQYPEICKPMMGLHPCSVQDDWSTVLDDMEALIEKNLSLYSGIGECGLDYYWDKSHIAEQKAAFERQILLAKKYQLPLIIHSRDAMDDCIALVEKHRGDDLRGIFHCFSGTREQLDKVISLHFKAGIGGVVTFKNGGLDKVLQYTDLPHLVLETDAPYLAPVPYRGKRNEPAYLRYVVDKLSELLQCGSAEIMQVTTDNARQVF